MDFVTFYDNFAVFAVTAAYLIMMAYIVSDIISAGKRRVEAVSVAERRQKRIERAERIARETGRAYTIGSTGTVVEPDDVEIYPDSDYDWGNNVGSAGGAKKRAHKGGDRKRAA